MRHTHASIKMLLVSICILVALLLLQQSAHATQFNFTCDDTMGRFCSQGQCPIPNAACVCDSMWSTKADFVNIENDCATSIVGMYVLWSLNLAILAYAYFKSLGVILVRIDVFREIQRTRKGYSIRENKGLIAVLVYFVLSSPFHVVMSIANLVDPELRIGFDLLPSVCFFFAKTWFYTAAGLVQATMLSVALKNDKKQRYLVQGNYAIQILVNGLLVLLGALAFVVYVNFQNDVDAQLQIMQAYYLCQAAGLMFAGTMPFVVMRKINQALAGGKELLDSQKVNKTEEIRKRVNESQMAVVKQSLGQAVVYLLMGAIPFFINKHKYFLPISWMAMPLLGTKIAHQFISDENSKSIMQRLGIKKTANSQTGTSNKNDMVVSGTVNPLSVVGGGGNEVSDFTSSTKRMGPLRKQRNAENEHSSFLSSDGTLLEDLLSPEHELHGRFVEFVRVRHANNEIALLQSTIKYRLAVDAKERKKLGMKIMQDFVVQGAPKQVDLPSHQRDVLVSTAKRSQFVVTTFDEIRRMLKFDLKGNFLGAFEKELEKDVTAENVAI